MNNSFFLVDIEKERIVKSYGIYEDVFEDWSRLTKNQDKVTYIICSEKDIIELAKSK